MVTAPMNSEKPRPALQRLVGGASRNHTIRLKEGKVPMAITIQANGRPRPNLAVVGRDTSPGIEVTPVSAEGLAECLNSLRAGELANVDEVTAFELLLAAAYNRGYDAGQAHERTPAGVS